MEISLLLNWRFEFPHALSSVPLEILCPVLVKIKCLTLQKIKIRIATCKHSILDKGNKPQPIKIISGSNFKLKETVCRVFQIAVKRGWGAIRNFAWGIFLLGVRTWGGVILMIWTFFKASNIIAFWEYWISIKMSVQGVWGKGMGGD